MIFGCPILFEVFGVGSQRFLGMPPIAALPSLVRPPK
jgi:hypothetical protein